MAGAARETQLLEHIQQAIKRCPLLTSEFANVIYLFYDDHDSSAVSSFSLIPAAGRSEPDPPRI